MNTLVLLALLGLTSAQYPSKSHPLSHGNKFRFGALKFGQAQGIVGAPTYSGYGGHSSYQLGTPSGSVNFNLGPSTVTKGYHHGGAFNYFGNPSPIPYTAPAPIQYPAPVGHFSQYSAPAPYSYPAEPHYGSSFPQSSPYSTHHVNYNHNPVPHYAPNAYGNAPRPFVPILRQNQDVSFDGSYNYGFESQDGIAIQSTGSVKALGPEEQAQVASGFYSYTAPDGTPISATWYADETGFHVDGAHIPKAREATAVKSA